MNPFEKCDINTSSHQGPETKAIITSNTEELHFFVALSVNHLAGSILGLDMMVMFTSRR